MEERWIVIPHWERFQHPDVGRSNRNPAWIKNHVELLHNDEYLDLTGPQRAVLHGLWMLYAVSRRNIPENTAKLSRKLGLRVTKRTLEALSHAGFIEVSACSPQVQIREEKNIKSLTAKEEQELWKTQLPKILKDLQ